MLDVPGAVMETDVNYLLNPLHPDFASITISAPHRFEFDLRLHGRHSAT